MFVASFATGPWQANCYLLAAAQDEVCAILDPGVGALDAILGAVSDYSLRPAAVLLTHGHIDHVAAAAAVADHFGIECWIHPADRQLLLEPALGLSPEGQAVLRSFLPEGELAEPRRVVELSDGQELELGEISIRAMHAPGHTPGSVIFLTHPDPSEGSPLAFTGDVLFAGSIGRTDLPTGDPATMLQTLRERVLPLADSTAVLPGHGSQSTIGRERASNPYLQPSYLNAA